MNNFHFLLHTLHDLDVTLRWKGKGLIYGSFFGWRHADYVNKGTKKDNHRNAKQDQKYNTSQTIEDNEHQYTQKDSHLCICKFMKCTLCDPIWQNHS